MDNNLNTEFFKMLADQGKENAKEINKVHKDIVGLGERVSNTTSKLDNVCRSFDKTAEKLNEFIFHQTQLSERFMVVPQLIDDVKMLKEALSEKNKIKLNKNLTYLGTGIAIAVIVGFELFSTLSIFK